MKADYAMLVVPNWVGRDNGQQNGARGVANVDRNAVVGASTPSRFSVVKMEGLGIFIFPHELGHNWGLEHNREQENCMNCAGYYYGPWAYVGEHCANSAFGVCTNKHYSKGVQSIMGYGGSAGCKDNNWVNQFQRDNCGNILDYGYSGFSITIGGIVSTWGPLAGAHEHPGIALGDAKNDPGRYLRENTLINANKVIHSCSWAKDVMIENGEYLNNGDCLTMTQDRAIEVCKNNYDGRWSTAATGSRPGVKCAGIEYYPARGVACFKAAPSGYSSGLARYDPLRFVYKGPFPKGATWGAVQTWVCAPPKDTAQAVRIKVNSNGKVVEVSNGLTWLDGAKVQQWEDAKQYPASRWVLRPFGDYFVIAANDDKCMEVSGSDVGDGGSVQLWGCDKTKPRPNVLWKVVPNSDGTVLLRAKHSGKCLDNSGSSNNGQQMIQWACNSNNNNQKFRIMPWDVPAQCALGGWCVHAGSVLSKANCNNDGALDWICEDNLGRRGALVSGACSSWEFSTSVPPTVCPSHFNGPRPVKITVVLNSKFVEVSNGHMTTGGAKIQQWNDGGQLSGRWVMYRHDGDYWSIRASDEYCMELTGNKNSDGALVHLWWCPKGTPADSQQRKIEILSDGTVMLRNKYSGKCLDNGGSWSDGQQMKQWNCWDGNVNQKFRVQSWII